MDQLNKGINHYNFYGSSQSQLLPLNDIGQHGENLTITFLSLNRIELSKRLISSMKEHLTDFKGELLIIDNGSEVDQLSSLKMFCKDMPFHLRIIELEKNFGVAGGRNRTMEFVNTDWVMCIDNDIYFIRNPIVEIRKALTLLGCHFLNIPLLDSDAKTTFAYGGNLYISPHKNEVWLGGGSCFKQIQGSELQQEQPFLSTFLFGGASILRKETFLKLDGYDENMFIGFEDIDFSIRLFQEGYKIGNVPGFSLVHDHQNPKNKQDINYEKTRFSSEIIEKSALYLEKKYGMKIWGPQLITWLNERNKNLGTSSDKKKVALVVDVKDWAFHNISKQIKTKLSLHFDFVIICLQQIEWNKQTFNLLTKDCDIVHFFWRENIRYFCPFFKTKREKIISTCVYDHLHLQDKEIIQRKDLFNHVPYYVSSNKLYEIYKSIHHYKDPILTIEDGVDEKNFYPINLERFENDQKPLIIGWVGNSQWGEDDHKGFNTFIKPAVNYFEEHNINIKSNFCDKVEKMVPHEEMVHYYSQIDILVCMSKSEGTPNPVLEAMACGVPIISTDVGIVSQAFGDLQKRFILPERSMNALLQAILEMYHQRRLLKKLSEENLVSIKGWYWDNQIIKFKHFFDQLSLQHNKLETNNNKKEQNITKTVTFCSKS